MEPAHYLYPLPPEYYDKHKIRRYGFHWTSHQFVYDKLVEMLKRWNVKMLSGSKSLKVITCHIGNGASITAIKDGKVIETSMWMTPLEWLMMGTRSGNIDPAIITYLMTHESMTAEQVDNLLNKQSWLLGVSWVSSDMRDIVAWIEQWNEKCVLALDMYINSLVKYIWAYVALLWWVDVIVLTAWIMEHRAELRKMLFERLSYLWIKIDIQANEDDTLLEKLISSSDSKVMVMVIPTNEELMIAEETLKLI
jgi:acetate kinase